jgi:flagellar biosynthesis protein FlhG
MTVFGGTRRRGTTVAITSGKGGVGKTSVTVNLAASLARFGHSVGVLDADFGLGNVDVMLGLTPRLHVGSLLAGDKTLEDVVVNGPDGIRVVPAGSGVRSLTALTSAQWSRLGDAMNDMAAAQDFLLVDTAPGIDDQVFELARLADHVIVVTSHEPTAIVDAYAMIKLLAAAAPDTEIGLVVNLVRDASQADVVFRQLSLAAMRFLGRRVTYYGFIARDARVSQAVMDQEAVVACAPDAPASLCFRRLALRIANLMKPGPRRAARPAGVRPPTMTLEEFVHVEAPRCA